MQQHSLRQPITQIGQACRQRTLFRDRYQVIRPLGRGGFGVTYLTRNVTLPSQPLCVIKQLCPKVQNPAVLRKAKERFEREAKVLSQLGSHSQIPRLLDYFEMGGEFYLVQEYIKGNNLSKEFKLKGPFSEAAVRQFLKEILPVLDYVHQHQVIHRDIKPPNIIRCQRDGRLVLIDFGAVKEQIAQVGEISRPTMTTQFVGTVGFAPPEQLALRPTFASDLYSIGVTCLYLMTGKPPLEFDYDVATGEICWQEAVTVSDYFAGILRKLLKAAPGDRYQTVEQLQRALDLEPHLPELNNCLSTQPPAANASATSAASDGYVSPFARTAESIRNWRSRLEERQRRQTGSSSSTMLSHSQYYPG
ncbi:MAG: protein kinase [Elainellaceae cyanobacterium]